MTPDEQAHLVKYARQFWAPADVESADGGVRVAIRNTGGTFLFWMTCSNKREIRSLRAFRITDEST